MSTLCPALSILLAPSLPRTLQRIQLFALQLVVGPVLVAALLAAVAYRRAAHTAFGLALGAAFGVDSFTAIAVTTPPLAVGSGHERRIDQPSQVLRNSTALWLEEDIV